MISDILQAVDGNELKIMATYSSEEEKDIDFGRYRNRFTSAGSIPMGHANVYVRAKLLAAAVLHHHRDDAMVIIGIPPHTFRNNKPNPLHHFVKDKSGSCPCVNMGIGSVCIDSCPEVSRLRPDYLFIAGDQAHRWSDGVWRRVKERFTAIYIYGIALEEGDYFGGELKIKRVMAPGERIQASVGARSGFPATFTDSPIERLNGDKSPFAYQNGVGGAPVRVYDMPSFFKPLALYFVGVAPPTYSPSSSITCSSTDPIPPANDTMPMAPLPGSTTIPNVKVTVPDYVVNKVSAKILSSNQEYTVGETLGLVRAYSTGGSMTATDMAATAAASCAAAAKGASVLFPQAALMGQQLRTAVQTNTRSNPWWHSYTAWISALRLAATQLLWIPLLFAVVMLAALSARVNGAPLPEMPLEDRRACVIESLLPAFDPWIFGLSQYLPTMQPLDYPLEVLPLAFAGFYYLANKMRFDSGIYLLAIAVDYKLLGFAKMFILGCTAWSLSDTLDNLLVLAQRPLYEYRLRALRWYYTSTPKGMEEVTSLLLGNLCRREQLPYNPWREIACCWVVVSFLIYHILRPHLSRFALPTVFHLNSKRQIVSGKKYFGALPMVKSNWQDECRQILAAPTLGKVEHRGLVLHQGVPSELYIDEANPAKGPDGVSLLRNEAIVKIVNPDDSCLKDGPCHAAVGNTLGPSPQMFHGGTGDEVRSLVHRAFAKPLDPDVPYLQERVFIFMTKLCRVFGVTQLPQVRAMPKNQWSANYTLVRAAQFLDVDGFKGRPETTSFSVKKELAMKDHSQSKPRGIQDSSLEYNHHVGPWIAAVYTAIRALWHINWPIYMAGGTESSETVSLRYKWLVAAKKVLAGDYSSYDASQCRVLREMCISIYREFGVPEDVLAYMTAKIAKEGYSKHGCYFKADGTMGTGEQDTFLSNSITNAFATLSGMSEAANIPFAEYLDQVFPEPKKLASSDFDKVHNQLRKDSLIDEFVLPARAEQMRDAVASFRTKPLRVRYSEAAWGPYDMLHYDQQLRETPQPVYLWVAGDDNLSFCTDKIRSDVASHAIARLGMKNVFVETPEELGCSPSFCSSIFYPTSHPVMVFREGATLGKRMSVPHVKSPVGKEPYQLYLDKLVGLSTDCQHIPILNEFIQGQLLALQDAGYDLAAARIQQHAYKSHYDQGMNYDAVTEAFVRARYGWTDREYQLCKSYASMRMLGQKISYAPFIRCLEVDLEMEF